MAKNKGYSKRPGNQKVMTKRTPKNKHNWEKHVSYASRMLNRAKYLKGKQHENKNLHDFR